MIISYSPNWTIKQSNRYLSCNYSGIQKLACWVNCRQKRSNTHKVTDENIFRTDAGKSQNLWSQRTNQYTLRPTGTITKLEQQLNRMPTDIGDCRRVLEDLPEQLDIVEEVKKMNLVQVDWVLSLAGISDVGRGGMDQNDSKMLRFTEADLRCNTGSVTPGLSSQYSIRT
jgi:hypothetical protein